MRSSLLMVLASYEYEPRRFYQPVHLNEEELCEMKPLNNYSYLPALNQIVIIPWWVLPQWNFPLHKTNKYCRGYLNSHAHGMARIPYTT